jgi:hypothetical protein
LLDLSWTPADDSGSPALEAKNILARELTYIQELVYSLGGEIVLPEGRSEIQLKIPAAPLNPSDTIWIYQPNILT